MKTQDIVEPFPPASRGRKYLFVAMDYFTKLADAVKKHNTGECNENFTKKCHLPL